jgi:hypothetical protein
VTVKRPLAGLKEMPDAAILLAPVAPLNVSKESDDPTESLVRVTLM